MSEWKKEINRTNKCSTCSTEMASMLYNINNTIMTFYWTNQGISVKDVEKLKKFVFWSPSAYFFRDPINTFTCQS